MAVDMLVDSGKLDACCAAEAAAIIAKGGGTAPLAYDFANNKGFADAIEAIPSGGITPTGNINITEESTYDVTDKATAVVDFSATRADLAEAVTAKGVDTLPTASFDTIATNIGLIEGGGGIEGVFQITTTEDLTNPAEIHAFIVANHPIGWRWINTIPLSITNGDNHFMCGATFDNGSGTNSGTYTRRNGNKFTTISYTNTQTATFVLPAGTTLLMTRGTTF